MVSDGLSKLTKFVPWQLSFKARLDTCGGFGYVTEIDSQVVWIPKNVFELLFKEKLA